MAKFIDIELAKKIEELLDKQGFSEIFYQDNNSSNAIFTFELLKVLETRELEAKKKEGE